MHRARDVIMCASLPSILAPQAFTFPLETKDPRGFVCRAARKSFALPSTHCLRLSRTRLILKPHKRDQKNSHMKEASPLSRAVTKD